MRAVPSSLTNEQVSGLSGRLQNLALISGTCLAMDPSCPRSPRHLKPDNLQIFRPRTFRSVVIDRAHESPQGPCRIAEFANRILPPCRAWIRNKDSSFTANDAKHSFTLICR